MVVSYRSVYSHKTKIKYWPETASQNFYGTLRILVKSPKVPSVQPKMFTAWKSFILIITDKKVNKVISKN